MPLEQLETTASITSTTYDSQLCNYEQSFDHIAISRWSCVAQPVTYSYRSDSRHAPRFHSHRKPLHLGSIISLSDPSLTTIASLLTIHISSNYTGTARLNLRKDYSSLLNRFVSSDHCTLEATDIIPSPLISSSTSRPRAHISIPATYYHHHHAYPRSPSRGPEGPLQPQG